MAYSPLHKTGCARLGVMRLKAARLNVYEATTAGKIDGGAAGAVLRIEGAAVTHALNDQPDTGAFRVTGAAPKAGQLITVTSGDADLAHTLITGRILETAVLYEGAKRNVATDLRVVDPTWLMQRRKVLATYINQSATTIAIDLIARFCRGITVAHVTPNLPTIDAITFTNESLPQCLTAICERIGGSWFVDYGFDLNVFLTATEQAGAITDVDARTARHLRLAEDLSQVITRVIGRGGGGAAAIDVSPGAIEIPVNEGDAATWYSLAGGLVEVNTQVLSYTSVRGRGGVGALVGTGNVPTSPLNVGAISGAGLGAGNYQYAQTFSNATGETLAGPVRTIAVGAVAAPLKVFAARSRGSIGTSPASGMTPGGRYSWRVALLYGGGGYALGPPSPTYTVDQYPWEIGVGMRTIDPITGFAYLPSLQDSGIAEILQIQIHRTSNNGVTWYIERNYTGVPVTAAGWLETANGWDDGSIITNTQYPTGPIASFARTVIKAPMQAAPAGFTGSNLYRTVVNGAQLKRLATAVNTAADYIDSAADGTLGANAPTADTSGVVASSSLNVAAGSTEIVVTSTDPFTADGGSGWARIGDLVIYYSAIGANKLTGVPASGPGSLSATVRYGAQILVQPRLVGIPTSGTGAILVAIKKGDAIALRVEIQDDPAIAVMADRLKLPGQAAVTADGIIEDLVTDARFELPELLNQCRAKLAERKSPRLTLTFESRDDSLQVGRLVTVNTTQPPIAGTFRIQTIAFSEIAISGGRGTVRALRTVTATNQLFTFSNLLRQLRGREGGVP